MKRKTMEEGREGRRNGRGEGGMRKGGGKKKKNERLEEGKEEGKKGGRHGGREEGGRQGGMERGKNVGRIEEKEGLLGCGESGALYSVVRMEFVILLRQMVQRLLGKNTNWSHTIQHFYLWGFIQGTESRP